MSNRILISTAAFGLILFSSGSAFAQRNLIEGIIGGAINEAINGNNQRRTPPNVRNPPNYNQPQTQSAMPAESSKSPNESGQQNYTNPFGGAWQVIRQPPVQQPTRPPQPYVRPQPNYVQPQPQPYVQPQPTYTQPRQYQQPLYQTSPQVVYPQSTPTYTTPPVVPKAPVAQESIKLVLPKTQSEACSFTLVNRTREYSRALSPGQMQTLKGSPNTWYVRFNGPGGTTTYRLRDHTNYVFQSQGGGRWQLYKKPKVVVQEPPELPQ